MLFLCVKVLSRGGRNRTGVRVAYETLGDPTLSPQYYFNLVAQRRVELLAIGYEPIMLPLHYRAPNCFDEHTVTFTVGNNNLHMQVTNVFIKTV